MRLRFRMVLLAVFLVVLLSVVKVDASSVEYVNYTEDFVDNANDDNSPTHLGTHSVFADLQDYGSNYDQMQEEDTGGLGVNELRYVDGLSTAETVWATTGTSPYLSTQNQPTDMIDTTSNGAISSWYTFAATSGSGSGFTVNMSAYHASTTDSYPEWELDWTGDGTADASGSFTTNGATWGWENTGTISGLDTQTEVDACRVRFIHNKGGGGPDNVAIDAARLGISQSGASNYELDLEIGWETADFDESNEYLCIYPVTGGGWPSEALKVDVWNGAWTNVFSDLTPDEWNNVSIGSYLTDATFEIRFLGGTESGDTTQDTFEIDAVLIHTYSLAYTEDILEIIPIAESTTVSRGAAVTVTEVIPFSETVTTALSAAVEILEIIGFSESVAVAANFSLTILEIVGLAATTIATKTGGDAYFVYLFEVIGASETVTASMSASVTILETIGFADITGAFRGVSVSILESIALASSTITNQTTQVYLFEVIGLSDSLASSMGASVTILETIGFADVTGAFRGFYISILESIALSSSTATSQLTHYYIFEVIEFSSSVGVAGGVEAEPEIHGLLWEIFFSVEMWGYLGPIALVIGGYIVSNEDTNIGVLWFVVECLAIAQYSALVGATPAYWWHIFILLFGGMATCVYPLWNRRR